MIKNLIKLSSSFELQDLIHNGEFTINGVEIVDVDLRSLIIQDIFEQTGGVYHMNSGEYVEESALVAFLETYTDVEFEEEE